jgi:hypothetical protein
MTNSRWLRIQNLSTVCLLCFALICSDTYKCTISCEGGVTGLSVDKEALESYGDLRRILYVDSQTLRVNLLNHGSHEFEAPGSCV